MKSRVEMKTICSQLIVLRVSEDSYQYFRFGLIKDGLINCPQTFAIKGLLYIRNSGEFPLEPFYQLNVTASDTVHTKMAPVFVKIQTLNRYGPSFENPDYYIPKDITEHSEIYLNQPFFKLAASDEDKGSSSEITYRIIGERASQKYRVEPKTGKLFLQSPIDREDPNLERVIRIMASDSMGRHAFTNVHVGIRDINDQIPKFEMSSYHAILYEPIPAGYYVVKVSYIFDSRFEFDKLAGIQCTSKIDFQLLFSNIDRNKSFLVLSDKWIPFLFVSDFKNRFLSSGAVK